MGQKSLQYYAEPMDAPTPSSQFPQSDKAASSTPQKLISVRLSDDLIKRLAKVGNKENLSMSDTIRVVLDRGLETKRKKKSKK